MAFIRVKTGPNKGKTFEVKDPPLTIGRDDNQVIQILDQGVSRAHAEIFRLGEMCFVRDLNSTNGSYVNDVRVTEDLLKSGDELLIGTTLLVFVDESGGTAVRRDVEFEGEEGGRIENTTVELRVEEKDARVAEQAIGREIQSRNVSLTSQVGRILRAEATPEKAFEKVLQSLCSAMGANQAFLFMLDRASGKMTPRAVFEVDDAGEEKKVSRTIVNRVRESGMPLLTTDAALDGRFALSESVILKKIKSVICVPIFLEERVEGLLYFHSSKVDHTLTVEDLELTSSVALQLSMALATSDSSDRLRKGLMATIRTLVTAMEVVDPKNQGHAERVGDFSAALAVQMGLPPAEVHRVRLAALLHDVGKLSVRESAAGLSPERLREEHVRAGEKLLTGIEGFEEILPGIRYHHERADGSGFPYRLKNAETPVLARILIVTNAFDNACTWGGLGGQGMPAKDVIKDMAQRGGREFDDDVIKALLVCHRNGTLYGATSAPAEIE
jgi:response regulator RpfG family c-di-GMP phosphodiesterase/pSer/pThr/pTyr-binding forkhead associated (FHA) protein